MKTHAFLKAKGTARVNHQQVMFELKQRVVFALNKLADRDTYQIGQKSAVRKECIRLMGLLVTIHEGIVGPHLGKMVASIVKRLKDPDSVVRDTCVETVGVLASKLSNDQVENDGIFVALVKPLFEALGEQNKQVQAGAALCLARVIDNTNDPPVSILQRMLTRTIKLLKNPHFMAKPAVIELNRSIIQAGGAPSQSTLSAAMSSIQEALKNSDWATRKAASLSLGEIASSSGSFFSSFKSSCIRSLESCRFDKVKPVRDTVLQALHLWRSLPGHDTPEPSEAGSSIKGLLDHCTIPPFSFLAALKYLSAIRNRIVEVLIPLSLNQVPNPYVDVCKETASELASIQKQLLEIETKQSNLMDMLKVFTRSTMDSLSMIQLKVSGLEQAVDRIAQDGVYGGRCSDLGITKLLKKSPSVASPRLSACTPRPSIDARNRQPSSLSMKNTDICEDKAFARSRSSSSAIENMWSGTTDKLNRKPMGNGSQISSGRGTLAGQTIKNDSILGAASTTWNRQNSLEFKTNLFKHVKSYLSEGDLDSAYAQALCSGDELLLIELIDRTGPVLESLSHKTASDVLSTLASYILEQRFINSIIPWLQQASLGICPLPMYFELRSLDFREKEGFSKSREEDSFLAYRFFVHKNRSLLSAPNEIKDHSVDLKSPQVVDLSTIHGPNYLVVSAKARREFLLAIQEAANLSNPAERRPVTQLAMRLDQIWDGRFSVKSAWKVIRNPNPMVPWFKGNVPGWAFIEWLGCWGSGECMLMPYVLCNQGAESHEHLFFSCIYSGQIWTRVLDMFRMNRSVSGWSSELFWAAQNLECASFGNVYKLVLFAVVYHVWGERNARIFGNQSRDKETVFRGIE
ncbi:ARM repeat superfamily protein [Actinidia rufa]|uniref:ARM repeat superfamily protein n=1 Tax=Actinidia rufa TaxID=165716 RepID=A0A7J0E242_9ERIC|nr:ARM repeat superfamily protein [Actinidia rufa]